MRQLAPTIPIYANFGAVQLADGYGEKEARAAVDMIEADALYLHLNPLQEALQPEGDRDWRGILDRIAKLARAFPVPIIAKEIGCGISGAVARRLVDAGVAAIDVAGAGGTSWALVESERALSERDRAVARSFASWGIPTADALRDVRACCPDIPLIASGGIKDGITAAKAIRLGADVAGIAAGTLEPALISSRSGGRASQWRHRSAADRVLLHGIARSHGTAERAAAGLKLRVQKSSGMSRPISACTPLRSASDAFDRV